MHRDFRATSTVFPIAVLLSLSATSRAQTSEGFAVNRFEPSERGSEWFAADSLDFRPEGLSATGVVMDWGHRPLVFRADDGTTTPLIADQVYAHAGASFVFWHRLRLSTSLPLAMHQTGQTVVVDGVTYPEPQRTAVGDLRLSADYRLLGNYREAFTLAAGARAWLPTGDRAGYAGDDTLRVGAQLLGSGEIGPFAYAARLGLNYRGLEDTFGTSSLGSEVVFAVSAGVRALSGALLVGPELRGSTVVTGGLAFSSAATPVELLFGGHYTYEHWRFGAGVGPGLSRGFGAPEVRTLLSAEYVFGAPAELHKAPQAADCAPPRDSDSDGVADVVDACPAEGGPSSSEPLKNGCPLLPDSDGDGVGDVADACPNEAGAMSVEPANNGCPATTDVDADGITDAQDACPNQAGAPSASQSENGCPRAKLVGANLEVSSTVEFEPGSAELTARGKELLSDVARVIAGLASTAHVAVHGHTDNKGRPSKNLKLSEDRAQAVVRWLATEGKIPGERLSAKGFGDTVPVANNDTDEGRQKNRRVEFNIEGANASGSAEEGSK